MHREQQIGRVVYTKSRRVAKIFAQRASDLQRYMHREQQIGKNICTESSRLAEISAQRAAYWQRYLHKEQRLADIFVLRAEDW